jgi:glycerophosphoryl diester phosphodiesterase
MTPSQSLGRVPAAGVRSAEVRPFSPGTLSVVGHRGLGGQPVHDAGAVFVPNGRDGFLHAAELGAPWVELDVRVTAAGELAVVHDEVLPDGTVVVHAPTARLGAHGVDRFEDVLRSLPPELGVVVDIKSSLSDLSCSGRTISTVQRVVHALTTDRLAAPDRPVLLYGENPTLAATLTATLGGHEHAGLFVGVFGEPESSLVGLTAAAVDLSAAVVAAHVTSFLGRLAGPPYCHATTAQVIEAGHAAGVQFLAWGLTGDQVAQLADRGVDAVCVDDVPAVMADMRIPDQR